MVAVDARGQMFHVPFRTLKDSKKLTAKEREALFVFIKKRSDIKVTTARVYPRGIEKMNISAAANNAALKAFEQLVKKI